MFKSKKGKELAKELGQKTKDLSVDLAKTQIGNEPLLSFVYLHSVT